MNTFYLQFANNSVALSWKDEQARDLVYLLFGSQPPAAAAEPQAHFWLASGPHSEEITLSIQGTPQDVKGPPGQIGVRLLELASFHLAERSRGGLLFRAAYLGRGGQAWMFPAPPGSGKSSLALWLTSLGFEYRSDELAFLPFGSRNVQGFFRAIYIKLPEVKLFAGFDPSEWLPVEPGGGVAGGVLIPPDWSAPPGPRADLPLHTILFPRYHAGEKLALQPLATADASLELSKTLVNARNLPHRGFPEVVQLVRSLPAYRLIYGSLDQITDAVVASLP